MDLCWRADTARLGYDLFCVIFVVIGLRIGFNYSVQTSTEECKYVLYTVSTAS